MKIVFEPSLCIKFNWYHYLGNNYRALSPQEYLFICFLINPLQEAGFHPGNSCKIFIHDGETFLSQSEASLLCDFNCLSPLYYTPPCNYLQCEIHPVSACSNTPADIFSDFPELFWEVSVRQVKRRSDWLSPKPLPQSVLGHSQT